MLNFCRIDIDCPFFVVVASRNFVEPSCEIYEVCIRTCICFRPFGGILIEWCVLVYREACPITIHDVSLCERFGRTWDIRCHTSSAFQHVQRHNLRHLCRHLECEFLIGVMLVAANDAMRKFAQTVHCPKLYRERYGYPLFARVETYILSTYVFGKIVICVLIVVIAIVAREHFRKYGHEISEDE